MAIRMFRIKIDGKVYEAEVEEIGSTAPAASKQSAPPRPAPAPSLPQQSLSGNTIVAPMPGKIIAIKVSPGQKIKAGDSVLILEAMKMEQEIKSPLSGTVRDILVKEGETVKKEQALLSVE